MSLQHRKKSHTRSLGDYDPTRAVVTLDGLLTGSMRADESIQIEPADPQVRPFPAGIWSRTFTLNSAEVEAARAAAHPDDLRRADEIAAKIAADQKRELERISIVKGT